MSRLRRVDRVLAPLVWLAAAVFLAMLLLGPAVVAQDKNSASGGAAVYGGGAGVDARAVFKGSCGSCHTLSSAGTSGQVGPNLNGTSLSVAQIESQVRSGGGGMPSFEGKLSNAQIKAVAAFVAASR